MENLRAAYRIGMRNDAALTRYDASLAPSFSDATQLPI